MKMKKFQLRTLVFASILSATMLSCKSGGNTDAEISTEVSKKLDDEAGSSVTASVNNGVVTLTGTCRDEECRRECAEEAKGVKGVKDVVNNITVAAAAPVEVSNDATLQSAVDNVVKEYRDVKAEVKDGVVTLRGEISRDKLQELMMALNSLKPKSIDNQLAVK